MSDDKLKWADLASTKVGDVEPPKSIPAGHYVGLITGRGEVGEKGKNKTLYIEFPLRLTEPLDDVDSEDFAASDGFAEKGYKLGFFLTPNSLFRFTEFGKGMGANDEMSVPEMAEFLAECGEPLVVEVRHDTPQEDQDKPEGQRRSFMRLDNPVPQSAHNA